MKKTMAILALMLFATASMTVAVAVAQGPGMMNSQYNNNPYSGYGLTQDQYMAAQEAYSEYYKAMEPKQSELYSLQYKLNAELYAAEPDKGAIEDLTKRIGALMGELYKARVDFQLTLRDKGLPPSSACGMGGGMGMGSGMMMGPGGGWGGQGHMMGPGGWGRGWQ